MADKLISQSKAVSIINRMVELPTETRAKVIAAINRVEEAEQKWIPVTERLPETFGSFLVTIKEHHGENRYSTDCADFDPFAKTWKTFNYWCAGWEVTHWMPLPEPPKGE